jgi:histidyl-tRNA synthetase
VFSYKRQNLSRQMKQASAAGARAAVIVGEETAKDGRVTVKDLGTGEQQSVAVADFLVGISAGDVR